MMGNPSLGTDRKSRDLTTYRTLKRESLHSWFWESTLESRSWLRPCVRQHKARALRRSFI
eukprot:2144654-Prymnesium_polylepis.2